jgi:hypothetical protein
VRRRIQIRAIVVITVVASILAFAFLRHGYWPPTAVHAGETALPESELQTRNKGVYAPDPEHIWNRVFRLLYVRKGLNGRQYGGDELDPYLWWETKYLLSGPSLDQALKLLDEFLRDHSERLVTDPLKRGLFQRDLLAVYDWASYRESEPGARALQKRLEEIIRRLGLSKNEIRKLEVNYGDAVRSKAFSNTYDRNDSGRSFLPMDLFDTKGPWVCLGEQRGRPVASDHLGFFEGRSVFLVFFQVPGGRAKTLEYLKTLRDTPKTWGPNPDRPQPIPGHPTALVPFPEPPQFPIGTRMALVRQAVLIDDHGHPTPTHLTESVQIRVYRAIHFDLGGTGVISQDFFEFRLSRGQLFSGESGGLRAIRKGEREFPFFRAHGFDMFETDSDPERGEGAVLLSCSGCHEAAGIHSFLSYSRERFGPTNVPPPKLIDSTPARESDVQLRWIHRHRNSTLGQGSVTLPR